MKRIRNLYSRIYEIGNLIDADRKAQRGKSKQIDIIKHRKNCVTNLLSLHHSLKDKSYRTSSYRILKIYEPKEREISILPYYPDRICHHAIMNIVEPIFIKIFISNTYSCIKGRGIHKASYDLRYSLRDEENTKYCLKLDIKKYFQNIDHNILKILLRRKFKDKDLLNLFDEIIDSHDQGLPLGNYSSSMFANFYLTYFDHWIKEEKRVKYYFRYCDDLVILHSDKDYLHNLFKEICDYLQVNLKLQIKENYQIFPVESRSIDFVGYKHYHTHTLLRKSIKKKFIENSKQGKEKSVASHKGWLDHCSGINLWNKYASIS